MDWGILTDQTAVVISDSESAEKTASEVERGDRIPFQSDMPQEEMTTGRDDIAQEYISISQLVQRLCDHLPDTKIRVFKVPTLSATKFANVF